MADTLISDTGSNSLPSGLPQPVHMIFDGTNYWCFYGSSTQSSQICYRNATTPTSWGSETTASGTSFPTADARIFTVIFNSATNCILIAWYDSPNNKISYRRGIINSSAATISWGTLTSAHNNVFGATSLAGTLNSSNVPVVAYVGGSTTATLTATNALTSSFADALWATVSTFSGQYISPTVSAIFPLASGGALILYDDYHSSGGTSYLDYSTYSGSSWSTYTTLWSGTGTSRTQWGSCQISTTDIAVLGVSATNTFSFQQFNGSTWSSLTAPAWPSTPLKSPSSICLTTDGTIYYAFVIDTGGYIEVNIWDGSAWSGWQVLSTFGYDTTRTYIQAGVQTPSWLNITYTRSNGTTYELRTISFSTTPASVTAAGAATLDALTGAGAGAFLAPGSGAATLAALTGAGVGTFTAPGSGTATLAALTGAGIGTFTAPGSGAATLAALTGAGAGTFRAMASGAATLAALTGAGAGAFLAPGTGVAILAALTGNGVGTFTAPGSGTATLAALTGTGIGAFFTSGTGAATLATMVLAGTGNGILYLPYEFTSVAVATGNANPFDIDPEQTTPIVTGNANPFDIDPEQTTLITVGNANPFDIDPEQTTPIVTGNANPFDIDPEQTTPITVGNVNPFDIDPEQTALITVGLTPAD